jgi:hypothetical protein
LAAGVLPILRKELGGNQMLVAGTLAILVVLSLFLSMLSSPPRIKD